MEANNAVEAALLDAVEACGHKLIHLIAGGGEFHEIVAVTVERELYLQQLKQIEQFKFDH